MFSSAESAYVAGSVAVQKEQHVVVVVVVGGGGGGGGVAATWLPLRSDHGRARVRGGDRASSVREGESGNHLWRREHVTPTCNPHCFQALILGVGRTPCWSSIFFNFCRGCAQIHKIQKIKYQRRQSAARRTEGEAR